MNFLKTICVLVFISINKNLHFVSGNDKKLFLDEVNRFNSIWDSVKNHLKLSKLDELTELMIDINPAGMLVSSPSTDSEGMENMFAQMMKKTESVYSQILLNESLPVLYETLYSTIDEVFHNFIRNSGDSSRQEKIVTSFQKNHNSVSSILVKNVVGPMGNLLQTYRDKVQCNTFKLQALCLRTVAHVKIGQFMEAEYYRMTGKIEKLQDIQDMWLKDMNSLGGKCLHVVEECSSEWRRYAEAILNDVYDKQFKQSSPSKQLLAEKLYAALSSGIPQRIWAVWVYGRSFGFGEHTVSSPNVHLMKWHNNDVTVTIASFKESNPPLSEGTFSRVMAALSEDISRECREEYTFFGAFTQKSGPYMDRNSAAKKIVMFVEHELANENPLHLVYAIRKSNDIVHLAAPNRSNVYELHQECVRYPYQVFIFQ